MMTSSPAQVPGIYTKLLDVDKVDLIIGAYATAQIAPAMPIAIQKKKTLIGLMGLAVNSEFKYQNYFSMIPSARQCERVLYQGFLTSQRRRTRSHRQSPLWPPTKNSHAMPQTARAKTRRCRIQSGL